MHVTPGFCYVIVDHERKLFMPPVVYRGSNEIDIFIRRFNEKTKTLMSVMKSIVLINLTDIDNIALDNDTHYELYRV